MQADAAFRKQADDLKQLKVRNDRAGMVPLATVAKPRWISGPVMIQRYNMYISAPVNGCRPPASAPARPSGRWNRPPNGSSNRSTP